MIQARRSNGARKPTCSSDGLHSQGLHLAVAGQQMKPGCSPATPSPRAPLVSLPHSWRINEASDPPPDQGCNAAKLPPQGCERELLSELLCTWKEGASVSSRLSSPALDPSPTPELCVSGVTSLTPRFPATPPLSRIWVNTPP